MNEVCNIENIPAGVGLEWNRYCPTHDKPVLGRFGDKEMCEIGLRHHRQAEAEQRELERMLFALMRDGSDLKWIREDLVRLTVYVMRNGEPSAHNLFGDDLPDVLAAYRSEFGGRDVE